MPLDGYGITDLSLSQDGNVLVGQLNGRYGTIDSLEQKPHQNVAWNVKMLIDAALGQNEADRLTKHIPLSSAAMVALPSHESAPAGTAFDSNPVILFNQGNIGDVVEVDVKRSIAHQLLGLPAPDSAEARTTEGIGKIAAKAAEIKAIINSLQNLSILKSDIDQYSNLATVAEDGMTLVTEGTGASKTVVSTKDDKKTPGVFATDGRLYLVPHISDTDVQKLRRGEVITGVKMAQLNLTFELKSDVMVNGVVVLKKGLGKVLLNVAATDYATAANSVFFGDRPLDNPGYSNIILSGTVSDRSTNRLDIFKVEQRLKYLGYSAFGMHVGAPTTVTGGTVGNVKEFKVDGQFGDDEESALITFNAITNYKYNTSSNSNGRLSDAANTTAAISVTSGSSNLVWLNAYNAPHWMNIYAAFNIPYRNDSNLGTNPYFVGHQNRNEIYATSWVRDLMQAWTVSKDMQGLTTGKIQINGLTDPTIPPIIGTQHSNGGHSVGMGIDLGIGIQYINDFNQTHTTNNGSTPDFTNEVGKAFSKAFAVPGTSARTYAVTAGALPMGLTLNPNTGMVTGTTTVPGTFAGTITASNVVIVPDEQNVYVQAFNIEIFAQAGWSIQNALDWSSLLPSNLSAIGKTLNDQRDALRNFLSIFAVTRNDSITGNGTWDDLSFVNGTQVRAALFGSGAQDTHQLIQNVWIGGASGTNTFPGMNAVLGRLGFDASGLHHEPLSPHHNHFHVDLRAPERVNIVQPPKNLLSDAVVANAEQSDAGNALHTAAQYLLDQLQSEFNLEQEEVAMFVLDMPNVPPQFSPVMIAQVNQEKISNAQPERQIGVCHVVSNYGPLPPPKEQGEYMIEPVGEAKVYFELYENKTVKGVGKVTVLQQPLHGELVDEGGGYSDGKLVDENHAFSYQPTPGYIGKDSATLLVEIGGFKVKVRYYFQAVKNNLGNDGVEEACRKARPNHKNFREWKISSTPEAGSSLFATTAWADAALASDITLSFADLPGSSVGSTVGTTITLDDNAAGYNWFIDPTPGLNEEFLPTSNPNEWIAKADSSAAGKMDMLSVLLHEYGHALGIDHSANPNDFMGTTLSPGVRRLPTADELTLMAQLVGEAKASLDGSGSSDTPDTPNPTLPLSGGIGIALLGRLRRSSFGSLVTTYDEVKPIAQYEVAANPKLTDAKLQTGTGWSTEGNVAIGNGAAILSESATQQTRLNQVFIVGEHDRYLTFTLAGIDLSPSTSSGQSERMVPKERSLRGQRRINFAIPEPHTVTFHDQVA